MPSFDLELILYQACKIVFKNAEGELTQEEIKNKVLSYDDDNVLNRALDIEMNRVGLVEMEKVLYTYGIQKAMNEFSQNDSCPDVEDLVRCIIRDEFLEWAEEDDEVVQVTYEGVVNE